MQPELKEFSSISPSAKSLLMLKGYTNIPHAKQLAALMQGPEVFDLNFDDKDFWFWIRVMHFESRYWCIDQLIKKTTNKNILELSSGFSLRGLDLCASDKTLHYIDTDLQEVITHKQAAIAKLQLGNDTKGIFELLPLNAIDASAFENVIGRFDDRPLTIVNEGLLMYLNLDEKKLLCKSIHSALSKHGGCWITGDIYIKRLEASKAIVPQSQSESTFFQQHNIEENKFDSYGAAQTFFNDQCFEMVMEAAPNFQEMSALPHLLKVLQQEARNSKEPPPKIQATWMLKAV